MQEKIILLLPISAYKLLFIFLSFLQSATSEVISWKIGTTWRRHVRVSPCHYWGNFFLVEKVRLIDINKVQAHFVLTMCRKFLVLRFPSHFLDFHFTCGFYSFLMLLSFRWHNTLLRKNTSNVVNCQKVIVILRFSQLWTAAADAVAVMENALFCLAVGHHNWNNTTVIMHMTKILMQKKVSVNILFPKNAKSSA